MFALLLSAIVILGVTEIYGQECVWHSLSWRQPGQGPKIIGNIFMNVFYESSLPNRDSIIFYFFRICFLPFVGSVGVDMKCATNGFPPLTFAGNTER